MPSTNKPNKSRRERNAKKTYFLIITLISVIGTLIALGFLLLTIGKNIFINNDEYIISERYYDLDQCSNQIIMEKQTVTPSKKDIEICKTEKKAMLIQSRTATFKKDLIKGSIRTILFLILLITHYPKFMKFTQKE